MGKVVEFIKMMRPLNSVMTGAAVLFTVFVVNGYAIMSLSLALIGFLTGFFISSASMLINDVVDLEVDRINKPWKPLPRGLFNPKLVKYFSIASLALGVLLNTLSNPQALLTAAAYSIIAYSYNFLRNKWFSHFLVSIATTGPFIYGYLLSINSGERFVFITLFSIVVFLINTSREFVKSIADERGDRAKGYQTITTVFGGEFAAKLSLALAISGTLLAVVIGLAGYAGLLYTIILGLSGALFSSAAIKVLQSPVSEVAQKAKKTMIYSMLFALTGFLFSNFP
ncbi:MAG: geranylgeranylglycerol-phosphate geranylgeranyltransferase [Desulfurococcaceae archaeon]